MGREVRDSPHLTTMSALAALIPDLREVSEQVGGQVYDMQIS